MGGYGVQWFMFFGSFICIWIYGFAMYFWLGAKWKKEDEEKAKLKGDDK